MQSTKFKIYIRPYILIKKIYPYNYTDFKYVTDILNKYLSFNIYWTLYFS